MANYNKGGIMGIVGYNVLYPETHKVPDLRCLIKGLPRIWAARLISNMQNKIVSQPFYNPNFINEEKSQIDVPRFFLSGKNADMLLDIIQRFKTYLTFKAQRHETPMTYGGASETPLYLLRYIMSVPEQQATDDLAEFERNMLLAYLLANDATMDREHGDNPYKESGDLEMYMSTLLMSRYAYNDFTNIKAELKNQMLRQLVRTEFLFKFVENHSELQLIYKDFLDEYKIACWRDYTQTYFGIVSLTDFHTAMIPFDKISDEDRILTENVIDRDSINLNETISLDSNIDYVAFREKPFLKIAPHEYMMIDAGFVIDRMFNGVYFILNQLWQKRYPNRPDDFLRTFSTEFSEEMLLAKTLKEVSDYHGWFSLSDSECKRLVNESKLSSPPDFYIRDGRNVILFENKDVKIRKEIKQSGNISELLEIVDRNFVGQQTMKGFKPKGVGQLVRNAKRVQDGEFLWDAEAAKDSELYLVLVIADNRQVAAGWKNYLNRKMEEECKRQNVDRKHIHPLILTDIATLQIYKTNFRIKGLVHYFQKYIRDTRFDCNTVLDGDHFINVMNQTLSYGEYMMGERVMGMEELRRGFLNIINRPIPARCGRSFVTKTVEYGDLFDDNMKSPVSYLSGINRRWLIEGLVHMISVSSYDSFSMSARKGLLVMFQDYADNLEVKRLFDRLDQSDRKYKGIYHTLINHHSLYVLLRAVLLSDYPEGTLGESFEAYQLLLKAMLAQNSMEMEREKNMLGKIEKKNPLHDSLVIMQQDLLNIEQFGENINELEKTQELKFMTLVRFGKENKKVGNAIQQIVERKGFSNIQMFLLIANMPTSVYHDKEKFGEGLICLRKQDFTKLNATRLWDDFVSYISDKCMDIRDHEKLVDILADNEMLANTCFKKYPVLKMNDDEYLLVSQFYYCQLFYDAFWWELKAEMEKEMTSNEAFEILTKEFAERYLLCKPAELMKRDRRIKIYNEYCFDDKQPAPDFTIRTRHDIFMFEYKDMRVMKEVAEGDDMNKVLEYIDSRLNHKKQKSGEQNKGIPQLISDMEEFFSQKKPWLNICAKGNVRVHPVLVVHSRTFTTRGLNVILQQRMEERIAESEILKIHKKEIRELTVIDYDMLLITIAWSYKDFSQMYHLICDYHHYIINSQKAEERNISFRGFAMNYMEKEMPYYSRKFKHGFKRIVTKMIID